MKKRRKVSVAPGQYWELGSILYTVRKVTGSNVVVLSEVASDKAPKFWKGAQLTRVRHFPIKTFIGAAVRHQGEPQDWIRKKNGDETC